MDIVSNVLFNNPKLPRVIRPGFRDEFARPNADSLGVTDDGKVWQHAGTPWKVVNGHAAGYGTSTIAYVDGLASDGVITAVLGKAATLDGRGGVLIRFAGSGNYLYVSPNTSGFLTLYGVIGGATTISQTFDGNWTLATNDVLTVTLDGPQITVHLNGVLLGTRTVTDLQTATQHGLWTRVDADAEWESISFVAA